MMLQSHVFKLLSLCFLVWGALFYSSISSTVAIWYRSETFAHCFIILPICIYLINQKWRLLNKTEIRPSYFALLCMLPVLALWLFGSLAQLLVVEQAAAFLVLPLVIWCLMGNKIARILLFTMMFWMFSIPTGEFLIPYLQELTADITVWALQLTGIPVYREGLYIAIPGGLFEVAVACSGIRYLIASFTLGTLFAYLNYQNTRKRLIFVLFALALPLLANGIRAYGIVMIAHLSDMKYATGVDHLIYGWLFFGVVILVMFSIGSIWSDPPEKPQSQQGAVSVANPSDLVKAGVATLALVISTIGYQQLAKNSVSDFTPNLQQVFYATEDIQDISWLPVFNNATLETSGRQDGIDFYVAYYHANIQGKELINTANKLYNTNNWTVVKQKSNGDYNSIKIIDSAGRTRLLAYTYTTEWITSPNSILVKLSQAVQAFLGQAQTGFVTVMSMPLQENHEQHLYDAADALLTPDLSRILSKQ